MSRRFSQRNARLESQFVVTSDDRQNPNIIGGAFLQDYRLLLADASNKKVKLFDTKYNLINQKEFAVDPYGVAVYSGEEIAVTLPAKNQIVRLAVKPGGLITGSGTISTRFDCRGVAYTTKDKLVVSGLHSETPGIFTTFNTDGTCLSRFTNKGGDHLFFSPMNLALDRTKSTAYISNYSNNTVCAIDMKASNNVRFIYKNDNLKKPRGLSVDCQGNIYVCGSGSKNLQQISPDGRYIRDVLTKSDGLDRPMFIAFLPSRNKFVLFDQSKPAVVRLFSLV